MGETNGRAILIKFAYADSSQCQLAKSGSKSHSLSSRTVQEDGYLHKGNLCPAFRQVRGGQRILPAPAD